MKPPRRKINMGAIGIFFVLVIVAGLIGLYIYYFGSGQQGSSAPASSTTNQSTTNSNGNGNFDSKDNGTADGPSQPADSSQSSATSQPSGTGNDGSNTAGSAATSNDPYVYYNKGLAKISSKDYQGAITLFDQAISINKQIPEFYSKKAEAQVSLGQKSAAIVTVNDGLANNPGNTDLQNKLSILQSVVK